MNKFKLTIEYDYDFLLIGLSCHEKDYRIAWSTNKALDIELSKTDDLQIELKRSTVPTNFPFYEYIDEELYREYFLVANRVGGGLLIPEQKQVDYFLIIKGNVNKAEKADIIRSLKNIDVVLGAFDVEVNKLASKQNLIF